MKNIPEYGDLFSIVEFIEMCNDGSFIDYDGSGNYSDGKMLDENTLVLPSDIMNGKINRKYTHVVWYNR